MEKACMRCGATTTPLWRPEVLAGPKVLCNACGVKALYPSKLRGHRGVRAANNKEPAQNRSKIAAYPPQKHTAQQHVWQSNKRQRTESSSGRDVRLTSAQKPFFSLVCSYEFPSQNVVSWRVTDRSIDDTREFTEPMHAQAFIDECWLFIYAHLSRSKASRRVPAQAQQENASVQAEQPSPADKAAQQPSRPGHVTGQERRLHEAAAAADQASRPSSARSQHSRLPLSAADMLQASAPSPADCLDGSLREPADAVEQGGRSSHAGSQEGRSPAAVLADPALQHSSPLALRLPSIFRPSSSRLPVTRPGSARSNSLLLSEPSTSLLPSRPALDASAQNASAAAVSATTAAPTASAASKDPVPGAFASLAPPAPAALSASAASPTADLAAAPAAKPTAVPTPSWPQKSAKLANVALLHAPDKSHVVKSRAAVQSPGVFARKTPPKVPSAHAAHQEADGYSDQAIYFERPQARSRELAAGLVSHAQTSDSRHGRVTSHESEARHSKAPDKPPGPAHEVSHSNTTKLPLPEAGLYSCGHPLSSVPALPTDGQPGLHLELGSIQPAALPIEARQAGEPVSPGASSPVRQGSSSVCSEVSSFARGLPSWGGQKPRSKPKPRTAVLPGAASLALVAAAAAAEAEDAAASAVAAALARNGHALSQHPGCAASLAPCKSAAAESGSQDQGASQQLDRHQARYQRKHLAEHVQHAAERESQPKRRQADGRDTFSKHTALPAKRKRSPESDTAFDEDGDADPGSRSCTFGKVKQRHTSSRLVKRSKPHDYFGSQYCGVAGIRHTAASALRWRAGTWDPVAKKTVYVGSYDVEEDAAAAVDAWHVSQGRPPSNFPDGSDAQADEHTAQQQHADAHPSNQVNMSNNAGKLGSGECNAKQEKIAAGTLCSPAATASRLGPPGQRARQHGSASAARGARALVAKAAGRSPTAMTKGIMVKSTVPRQRLGLSAGLNIEATAAASNRWKVQTQPP